MVVIEGSKGVNGGLAEFKSFTFGVVGDRRNVVANISGSSTSAVFTGDCHVLSDSALVNKVLATAFSLTLNIQTTGPGGMAQGHSVPTSGYLAVWHIFNPTAGTQSVIATNCTGVKAPEVMDPASLPAGYVFSALLAIIPTGSDTKLGLCYVQDRTISIDTALVYSASTIPSGVVVSLLDKYPRNSKRVGLVLAAAVAPGSASQQVSMSLGPGSGVQSRVGEAVVSGYLTATQGLVRAWGRMPVSQDHNYVIYASGSLPVTHMVYINGWEI